MATVVMPIFIIGLFFFLIGFVSQQVSSPSSSPVAVVGLDLSTLSEQFPDADFSAYQEVSTKEEAEELLKEKSVRIVLIYDENFAELTAQGKASISVLYDADDPLSMVALSGIRSEIFKANNTLAKRAFEANNLSPDFAQPISLDETNIAKSDDGMAGSQITGLLPYLIVLWCFYGGMSIVSDMVAGEKERGTMETLLIAPIRRTEIALGKIAALSAICIVSGLTTIVAVILLAATKNAFTADLFPSGLQLSFGAILSLAATIITLSTFFSTLMVAISAYSRNIRESQTFLSLLSFVILMPAIFSQFIGFTGSENAAWVNFTPILNSAMAIRGAVKGEFEPLLVGSTTVINLVLTGIFLYSAVRLFRREEILLRS